MYIDPVKNFKVIQKYIDGQIHIKVKTALLFLNNFKSIITDLDLYKQIHSDSSWNHKKLNLGLVYNPSFRVDLKNRKWGFELSMFYYV